MSSEDEFSMSGSDADVELEFDGDPKKKTTSKSKAKQTKKTVPITSVVGNDTDMISTSSSTKNPEKRHSLAVEEKYQKMTQREHIIKRPDTYIGSIEKVTQDMWVYDSTKKGLVYRSITYVPGFYKIFDEILVNAADNKQSDPSMDTIKVTIDRDAGRVTIWNNGKGIPVVIHKEYKTYVPSLIFGQLLTGGNFNDEEKKVTGGRNGYGAKLTNIYSTEFRVETTDSKEGKKFVQIWRNNMAVAEKEIITSFHGKEYTVISYVPDLQLFNMNGFDDDIIALMEKRVYDMAGVTDSSMKVFLNDERVDVKDFQAYIKMYQMESESANTKENKIAFCKAGDRWEIGVGVSDGHAQQVSFVNSICTSKGGKHVDYIAQKVTDYLIPVLKRKTKKDVKPGMIKQYMYIFVNCLIENPAFDSQTKETLTTVVKNFGSLPELPEKFLQQISKCGIVESVTQFSRFKEDQMLKKQSGTKTARKLDIPKLDDANFAGTRQSKDCTLIITEGDSAKSLVVGGLSIIGRDYYGVFPLRGKMLNVRDVSRSSVISNEEIKNLVQILGLKFDTVYTETSSLRYGKLVIMADQDFDGSHIKGLVINFFQYFWPSLLKLDFLQQFITPIVKATNVTSKKGHMFFTIQQYKTWLDSHNQGKGYHIKYYKGLGTSTPLEGKEYFGNLSRHLVPFKAITDAESSAVDMVFRKSRVSERKEWISAFVAGNYVDYAVDQMAYSDFLDKELILFSRYDNTRSIPCVVDGFKPSQRKVLFGAFKRKLTHEIKVVQFSGYISEHAAYHHGEVSLNGTIISMAQDYVGANNVNLLVPSGQFGTRLMGGKDAASARYIYTCLSKITRMLYKEEDDALCNYLVDEGQSIEPEFYIPIIPMVLVNGSEGIGTGYSSTIPNYNPIDIVNYIKAKLDGTKPPDLHPWYRGFTGDIYKKPSGYLIRGRITQLDALTYVITELPIGRWTQDYKKFLTEMLLPEKKTPLISDFKENHTDTTVHFTVILNEEQAKALEGQDLYKFFKLESSITTTNFNLFDQDGHIHHYTSPQDIIDKFFTYRYPLYEKRKEYMLYKLDMEARRLNNMTRFILAVINGDLVVNNRKRRDIMLDLAKDGYEQFTKEITKTQVSVTGDATVPDEDNDVDVKVDADIRTDMVYDEKTNELSRGYDYLLSMKLWKLTQEMVEEMKGERAKKEHELIELRETPIRVMWERDLDAFIEELLRMEEMRLKEKKLEEKSRKRAEANRVSKKNARKSDAGIEDDLSDSSDSDDAPRRKMKAPMRLTAKEKAMGSLQQKAMEVRSRFSISAYYEPQVKEPTADMLTDINATVDPETGEITKVKRQRKTAVKKEGEEGEEKPTRKRARKTPADGEERPKRTKKSTEDGEEKPSKKRGKKVPDDDEIIEEEDDANMSLDLGSDSDESEDDVIRDNRIAIAARKATLQAENAEMKSKKTSKASTPKTIQTEQEISEEDAELTMDNRKCIEQLPNEERVGSDDRVSDERCMEISSKKQTPEELPNEDSEFDDSVEKKKPVVKRARANKRSEDSENVPKKNTRKPASKRDRIEPTVKEAKKVESESDEDSYIPLSERLKLKIQDSKRSDIVDALASTKSVVPTVHKKKLTAAKGKVVTEDGVPTVEKKGGRKLKKKINDESDDSLFGF